MKILFVGSAFLPEKIGGMELHMLYTARTLRRQGHDVVVFCRGYSPAKEEFAIDRSEFSGIPVVKMNYKFSDCTEFERLYSNANIARVFREVLGEYEPDLVHIHHLQALTMDIVSCARDAGIPVVMTLHDFWMGCPRTQRITASLQTCPEIDLERCTLCLRGLWPGFFQGGRAIPRKEAAKHDKGVLEAYHATVRRTLDRVDRLIAPSIFVKRIYERYGIPGSRLAVVPHGLDGSLFEGMRRMRSPVLRFGYLGPVVPPKGVHILIEAFKMIAGSDCNLHIWGEVLPFHKDTNYGHRLAVLVKGWESSILFHGRYEHIDVARVLSEIDILVVPSLWYESFSMTLMEGFQAGLPVIASNFGALASTVKDGETGLLFNVEDSVDLAKKMKRLKDDFELRQRLAASPKNVVSIEENVAVLKRVYGEVTGMTVT